MFDNYSANLTSSLKNLPTHILFKFRLSPSLTKEKWIISKFKGNTIQLQALHDRDEEIV
jgi:hypothetical protein